MDTSNVPSTTSVGSMWIAPEKVTEPIDSLGAAMIKDGGSSDLELTISTNEPKASPASEPPRTPAVF